MLNSFCCVQSTAIGEFFVMFWFFDSTSQSRTPHSKVSVQSCQTHLSLSLSKLIRLNVNSAEITMSQVKFIEGNASRPSNRTQCTAHRRPNARIGIKKRFFYEFPSLISCISFPSHCVYLRFLLCVCLPRRESSLLSRPAHIRGEAAEDTGEGSNRQVLHPLCRLEQELGRMGERESSAQIQWGECAEAEGDPEEGRELVEERQEDAKDDQQEEVCKTISRFLKISSNISLKLFSATRISTMRPHRAHRHPRKTWKSQRQRAHRAAPVKSQQPPVPAQRQAAPRSRQTTTTGRPTMTSSRRSANVSTHPSATRARSASIGPKST